MPTQASIQNLTIFKGTDKTIQDSIFQADGITPQNLTGWSLKFTIYLYGDSSQVFITKTSSGPPGGITISNPLNGTILINIMMADSINMYPGQYEYKIERVDLGFDDRPTIGLFTILP